MRQYHKQLFLWEGFFQLALYSLRYMVDALNINIGAMVVQWYHTHLPPVRSAVQTPDPM